MLNTKKNKKSESGTIGMATDPQNLAYVGSRSQAKAPWQLRALFRDYLECSSQLCKTGLAGFEQQEGGAHLCHRSHTMNQTSAITGRWATGGGQRPGPLQPWPLLTPTQPPGVATHTIPLSTLAGTTGMSSLSWDLKIA